MIDLIVPHSDNGRITLCVAFVLFSVFAIVLLNVPFLVMLPLIVLSLMVIVSISVRKYFGFERRS